jgi:cell fate regulator YaaT (PSP1 superfamily)
MRFLGVFTSANGNQHQRGERVIVRTDRGLEAGEVLCEGSQDAVERIRDPAEGQILRRMTTEDAHEAAQIKEQADHEMEVCQRFVDKLGLQMQLVDVEHIFGGERIVVYYLAENRVDFRELVRMLAGEFQTCCNTHLAQMPPVSMKMAKLQKATLDPTKISGRCGRLKCCLRYEYETYERIQKELPPLGSSVTTPEGRAKVIGHEILTGQLLVVTEDRRRILVDLDEAATAASEPVRKENQQSN